MGSADRRAVRDALLTGSTGLAYVSPASDAVLAVWADPWSIHPVGREDPHVLARDERPAVLTRRHHRPPLLALPTVPVAVGCATFLSAVSAKTGGRRDRIDCVPYPGRRNAAGVVDITDGPLARGERLERLPHPLSNGNIFTVDIFLIIWETTRGVPGTKTTAENRRRAVGPVRPGVVLV